jgi:hypothetical protein
MPAIITNKFRIHMAEQFQESFSEAASNTYYLGIGRPQPYGTLTRPDARTDNQGTDANPITPADSVIEETKVYDDLLAVKKISSSDISFVVPRRNWTSGTVYDYYRHDYGNRITGTTTTQTSDSGATTLFDATFYVRTADNRVYKCLDNNGGATVSDEPTSTSTSVVETSDGYKWKFMYTLTAAQQSSFLSTDFMAVATDSTVQSAAVNGSIDVVKIKTAGTGGTDGTHTGIPIRGDGSVQASCTVVISSGAVTSVTVPSGTKGQGYTYGYITLADINANGGGSLTGTELDVIIPPKGGHGSNAVEELGGFFVMLNQSLEGTESTNTGDYTAENDFRRILLIRDPNSGGSAASATTLRATKAIKIASSPTPGTFTADEKISQATTGAVGKVVEWDSSNNILYYVQTGFTDAGVDSNGDETAFSTAAVITGASSGATGTPDTSVTSTVNNVVFTGGYSSAEIDEDSGDVIYIENRAPIVRAADQTENIKLIIEF